MAEFIETKTAILIFAYSAKKEAEYKRFIKAVDVFETLNYETHLKVERSGLPFFHFSEENQLGNTFGERYIHAIQSIFNKGFESVITIGNDSPELQTKHLKQAARNISKKNIVLGPSTDGGYYLLGIHRSQFESQKFLCLPWQTSKLTTYLVALFQLERVQVTRLECLYDIDTLSDLKKATYNLKKVSKAIQLLVMSLFISEKSWIKSFRILFQNIFKKGFSTKDLPNCFIFNY